MNDGVKKAMQAGRTTLAEDLMPITNLLSSKTPLLDLFPIALARFWSHGKQGISFPTRILYGNFETIRAGSLRNGSNARHMASSS